MGRAPVTIDEALSGVTALGLDTAPLIYFVEAHPKYDARVTAIFERVAQGRLQAVTSAISLVEVLTQPIAKGDSELQDEYRDLLLNSDNFELLPVDFEMAERAAVLRASYKLRTPDALQVAAALGAGCQAFLTNDAPLKRVKEIKVLVLDELLP
jgi:predicted nucleic acid-binding protein